jgi:hypothetical protein
VAVAGPVRELCRLHTSVTNICFMRHMGILATTGGSDRALCIWNTAWGARGQLDKAMWRCQAAARAAVEAGRAGAWRRGRRRAGTGLGADERREGGGCWSCQNRRGY